MAIKLDLFCEYILFHFDNIRFERRSAYLRAQGKKFHDFFASALWVEREYFPIPSPMIKRFLSPQQFPCHLMALFSIFVSLNGVFMHTHALYGVQKNVKKVVHAIFVIILRVQTV